MNSQDTLSGQGFLVTGGSRGIGRAIAVEAARRGARVAVHYRADESAARGTLGALSGTGHLTVRADIADPRAVEAMVAQAAAELGRIDVLVNNAGVYLEHRITDVTYDEWQAAWSRTLDVNLTGTSNVTYCVVQRMLEDGQGAGS